jgi:hypothetical protein
MKYLEWKNLDGRMDMLGPAMKVVQGKLID